MNDVLALIRARVDLPALIGRDVALKKRGRAWSGLCPFHGERNPSFVVYGAPRPGWLCHGCGARGDAVGWLTARGASFKDAVAQLAAEHGIATPGREAGGASGGRRERANAPPPPAPLRTRDEADAERATARAMVLWNAARPLEAGDPVARYLAGRGLDLPASPDLRFHPRLPAPDQQPGLYPAMLALVRGPDGAPMGVHRTYLNVWEAELAAGPVHKTAALRAAKAMLGPVARGAVRLFPASETMGVAEGIETALSAAVLTGLPVWAALSANGIAVLELPFEVADVTVFCDRDEPKQRGGKLVRAGLDAARKAEARWVAEHRVVRLRVPRAPSKDYNDVLQTERKAA